MKLKPFFLITAFLPLLTLAQSLEVCDNTGTTDFAVSTNQNDYKGTKMAMEESTGKKVFVWMEPSPEVYNKDVFVKVDDKDMNSILARTKVNTTSTNDQTNAYVAVNQKAGYFVVAWTGNQSGNYDVYVKKIRFSSLATDLAAADMIVNTSTAGDQTSPIMAFDYMRDEMIIIWQDNNNAVTGTGNNVVLKRLNSGVTPMTLIGTESTVNERLTDDQWPRGIEVNGVNDQVLVLYDSKYNVADCNGSNQWADVLLRRFTRTSTGTLTGTAEFRVNTRFCDDQWNPRLSVNQTTGAYVVTYINNGADGWWGGGPYAKIYDKNNTVVKDEFRVCQYIPTNLHNRVVFPIWDETTNSLLFFYGQNDGTSKAYLKYQLYSADWTPVGVEGSAIGTINPNAGDFPFFVAYDQVKKNVHIAYDVYATWNTNAKGYYRQLSYVHPKNNLYADLYSNLDAGYYKVTKNKLCFRYNEKYNPGRFGGDLNYAIYDYSRTPLTVPYRKRYYGNNYYEINLNEIAGITTVDPYFILEVTDDTGDKQFLRFKYQKEF